MCRLQFEKKQKKKGQWKRVCKVATCTQASVDKHARMHAPLTNTLMVYRYIDIDHLLPVVNFQEFSKFQFDTFAAALEYETQLIHLNEKNNKKKIYNYQNHKKKSVSII